MSENPDANNADDSTDDASANDADINPAPSPKDEQQPPKTKPAGMINKPYLQIAEKEVVGIGYGGLVYDVNKLKNNLVQKSVRQFKEDLLLLLMGSESGQKEQKRRFNIEEKIAALVSANPVATTTDSNLLEGTWELAFATDNAVEILDEARFVYSRKSDKVATLKSEGNWRLSSGQRENPLHEISRSIYLEELMDHEDPFMVDTIRLFRGLWIIQRFYDIIGVSDTR